MLADCMHQLFNLLNSYFVVFFALFRDCVGMCSECSPNAMNNGLTCFNARLITITLHSSTFHFILYALFRRPLLQMLAAKRFSLCNCILSIYNTLCGILIGPQWFICSHESNTGVWSCGNAWMWADQCSHVILMTFARVLASTSLHHTMPREFAYRSGAQPSNISFCSQVKRIKFNHQLILLAIKDIQLLQNAPI